jgi:hypothetical protein
MEQQNGSVKKIIDYLNHPHREGLSRLVRVVLVPFLALLQLKMK